MFLKSRKDDTSSDSVILLAVQILAQARGLVSNPVQTQFSQFSCLVAALKEKNKHATAARRRRAFCSAGPTNNEITVALLMIVFADYYLICFCALIRASSLFLPNSLPVCQTNQGDTLPSVL